MPGAAGEGSQLQFKRFFLRRACSPLFSKRRLLFLVIMRRNRNLWTAELRFDNSAKSRGILLEEGLMKRVTQSPFGMPKRAIEILAPRVGIFFF
jgi:hypothetical protein